MQIQALHALVEDVGEGHVEKAAVLERLGRRAAQQHETLEHQAFGAGVAWRAEGKDARSERVTRMSWRGRQVNRQN